MRVGGIGGTAIPPRRAADRREPIPEKTRALIAIEAPVGPDRATSRTRHPQAPFLAQLIATQMQLPQTRARRRAEPADAVATYRVQAGSTAGRAFRRQA